MLFVCVDCVYIKLGYYQKSTFVLLRILSTPTLGTAGCPLIRYSLLFNACSEAMVREAQEQMEEGVNVGGHIIQTLRFADH